MTSFMHQTFVVRASISMDYCFLESSGFTTWIPNHKQDILIKNGFMSSIWSDTKWEVLTTTTNFQFLALDLCPSL